MKPFLFIVISFTSLVSAGEFRLRDQLLWRQNFLADLAQKKSSDNLGDTLTFSPDIVFIQDLYEWLAKTNNYLGAVEANTKPPAAISIYFQNDNAGKYYCNLMISSKQNSSEIKEIAVRTSTYTSIYKKFNFASQEINGDTSQSWPLSSLPSCPAGFAEFTLTSTRNVERSVIFVPQFLSSLPATKINPKLLQRHGQWSVRGNFSNLPIISGFSRNGLQLTLLNAAGRLPLWSEFLNEDSTSPTIGPLPRFEFPAEVWADVFFTPPPRLGKYILGYRQLRTFANSNVD